MDGNEGFVYFYQSGIPYIPEELYLIKIGNTQRGETPEQRVREIDNSQPFKGKLLYSFQSKECLKTEKLLHSYFEDKRTEKGGKKEWFILDENDVQQIFNFHFPEDILKSIRKDYFIPFKNENQNARKYGINNPSSKHYKEQRNNVINEKTLIKSTQLSVIDTEKTPFFQLPEIFVQNPHSLTLVEMKILHLLLFKNYHATGREVFSFSILDFCRLTGSSSGRIYETVKENINQLSKKSFCLSNEKRVINYIDYCVYNNGRFDLRLSEDLYTNLKKGKYHKTFLDIKTVLQFHSTYSLRIYGIILYNREKNMETYFPLDDFKDLLTGGKEGIYKRYVNLKSSVIYPAIKEIKELAGIDLEVVQCKEGRAVKSLLFNIN